MNILLYLRLLTLTRWCFILNHCQDLELCVLEVYYDEMRLMDYNGPGPCSFSPLLKTVLLYE